MLPGQKCRRQGGFWKYVLAHCGGVFLVHFGVRKYIYLYILGGGNRICDFARCWSVVTPCQLAGHQWVFTYIRYTHEIAPLVPVCTRSGNPVAVEEASDFPNIFWVSLWFFYPQRRVLWRYRS